MSYWVVCWWMTYVYLTGCISIKVYLIVSRLYLDFPEIGRGVFHNNFDKEIFLSFMLAYFFSFNSSVILVRKSVTTEIKCQLISPVELFISLISTKKYCENFCQNLCSYVQMLPLLDRLIILPTILTREYFRNLYQNACSYSTVQLLLFTKKLKQKSMLSYLY